MTELRQRWMDSESGGPGYVVRDDAPAQQPISRECMAGWHSACPGWAGARWAEGAAYVDQPLVKTSCGCPAPECDCIEREGGQ